MKRVLTVQDISCVGKCSLTVALPIISAMGVECSVLPTAVLSTHTAFQDFTFRDLTEEIVPICRHWKQQELKFDAIYTGYLGSYEQMRLVSALFDEFRTAENLIFVDPVMGDYGKLYPGFTPKFAREMGKLCAKADVIVPNMTEAAFMLGIDYVDAGYDEGYVRDVLRRLSDLGAKNTVLTGVSFAENSLGVMGYDAEREEFFSYFNQRLNARCHGTGDVFASCCVGGMMRGFSLGEALALAADFTVQSMRFTMEDPERRWYGVNFEQAIPMLVDRLRQSVDRPQLLR